MYALIGRVEIKPGHEDETLNVLRHGGVSMLRAMEGSIAGYWARPVEVASDGLVQHSFWLFDTEANARSAEATFLTLRETPDAPATFVSLDVCEVVGTS